tara:strand:- start:889 stop:1761 length:873 start_codon:yes stop_codon:yes gene_type:complete
MTKITILGGSGFLGSVLADLLAKNNRYKVTVLDTKKKRPLLKNQIFIKGSILNENKLIKAIRGSKYVFNFAALADLDIAKNKPLETANINIIGTIKSLIISKNFRIKKFIHASSIYANSEQGGFYGSSKKAAEDYIEKFWKKYNLSFTILRFGSLYGPNAGKNNGINYIIDNFLKTNQLNYKGKKIAARKYIHVEDACLACIKALSSKYDNEYLNITGKNKVKMIKVMKLIAKIFNYKKKLSFKNLEIEGHYVNEPKIFHPRKGKNLLLNKYKNFKYEIKKLIKERKKIK